MFQMGPVTPKLMELPVSSIFYISYNQSRLNSICLLGGIVYHISQKGKRNNLKCHTSCKFWQSRKNPTWINYKPYCLKYNFTCKSAIRHCVKDNETEILLTEL